MKEQFFTSDEEATVYYKIKAEAIISRRMAFQAENDQCKIIGSMSIPYAEHVFFEIEAELNTLLEEWKPAPPEAKE